MNNNLTIILIILILLMFVLINNFNNNIFDEINKYDSYSSYELCVIDCQSKYEFMSNIQRCIDNFCKYFKKE